MGWFESQVEERRRADDARLDMALRRLSDAVSGGHSAEAASSAARAASALDHVLAYYGAEPGEAPSRGASLSEVIDERLRTTGIMSRPVRLTGAWWRDAMGAMLGFDGGGEPVALVPGARGGYERIDVAGRSRVSQRTAADLREEAYCFYRPLPQRPLGVADLLRFMARSIDTSDWLALGLSVVAVTLLGLVAPRVNQIVFGPVLEVGDVGVVAPIAALLAGVLLAQVLLGGAKRIVLARIATRVEVPLEAAVMMRVLSMPASFFSGWQTGDLATRVQMVSRLAELLREVVLTAGLDALFFLVYVGQIAGLAPALALPSLAVLLSTTLVTALIALAQVRVMRRQLELGSRLSGWQLALVQGIQKIRLAGAEKRAFSTWADIYQGIVRLTYNGPVLVRLSSALQLLVSLAGSLLVYACALAGGVGVSQYLAFSVAYGSASAAFASLAGVAAQIASAGPYLGMVAPILEAAPETSERRPALARLSGGFELSSVTFSYGEGLDPVLSDLSLRVRPGEYVAVVGSASASSSRAVAGRPKILMFEEATSALDNAAQRAVSEALDGLRCTRLVIAPRLSTIRNADRVVVIEGGRIVEDGPYDELLALGGAFARLVERQQM